MTASGHKVHPELLEAILNDCPAIERAAVVLSVDRETLTAAIVVRRQAQGEHQEPVRAAIARANALAPSGTRIADHVVLAQPFSMDNGMLTRNLKLDRRAVRRVIVPDADSASP